MKLKRGLLRLWIVASVLWLAFMFVVARPDQRLAAYHAAPRIAVNEQTGDRYLLTEGKWIPADPIAAGSPATQRFRAHYAQYADLSDQELSRRLAERLDRYWAERRRDLDGAITGLQFMIVPPLFVLALG